MSATASTSTLEPASRSRLMEDVDAIVIIDNGACNIRIATVPYPPTASSSSVSIGVYPNFIARTRSTGNRRSYVSSQILTDLDEYGGLVLRQPHQKGMISDWAAQKLIWDHVFASHFGTARPSHKRWLENKAVIITESYFVLDEVRHATDLMIFEQYGAHLLWRCDAASLAAWTDLFDPRSKAGPSEMSSKDHIRAETSPSPAKRSRLSRTDVTADVSPATSKPKAARKNANALFRRPESFLILDLSYSACHAVPVRRGVVQYAHVRRLDVGGKILTNLLKETLSFRQLDMMDEFWLVDHIRRRTNFVAASTNSPRTRQSDPDQVIAEMSNEIRKDAIAPCDWTFDQLLILCKHGNNKRTSSRKDAGPDISILWKLPDYSATSSTDLSATEGLANMTAAQREEMRKYGSILSAPSTDIRTVQAQSAQDAGGVHEASYIAQMSPSTTFAARPKVAAVEGNVGKDDAEEDNTQYLTLSNERFVVPEVLFAPSSIGLAQNGLSELVSEAICSLAAPDSGSTPSSKDVMWANIVLVGGLSNIPGLKRRLEHEFRSLAPNDVPRIHVHSGTTHSRHPFVDITAIQAGIILASAPPSTPEYEWLQSRWLSNAEWTQASNSAELARARFERP